jgi:hypothetical protein
MSKDYIIVDNKNKIEIIRKHNYEFVAKFVLERKE